MTDRHERVYRDICEDTHNDYGFWNRYSVIRKLGSGSFGTTLLIRSNKSGRKYAIKLINVDRTNSRCSREYRIYRYLRDKRRAGVVHNGQDHIVKYCSHCLVKYLDCAPVSHPKTCRHLGIIMEYVPGIPLPKRGNLDPEDVLIIAQQLFEGLDYLHSLLIAHRDIKPRNIIWDADQRKLTIVDLGNCCTKERVPEYPTIDAHKHVALTPKYASPELNRVYTLKTKISGPEVYFWSDVWSAGLTIYRLLARFPLPDSCYEGLTVSDNWYSSIHKYIEWDEEVLYPNNPELARIILTTLSEQHLRPDAGYVRDQLREL